MKKKNCKLKLWDSVILGIEFFLPVLLTNTKNPCGLHLWVKKWRNGHFHPVPVQPLAGVARDTVEVHTPSLPVPPQGTCTARCKMWHQPAQCQAVCNNKGWTQPTCPWTGWRISGREHTRDCEVLICLREAESNLKHTLLVKHSTASQTKPGCWAWQASVNQVCFLTIMGLKQEPIIKDNQEVPKCLEIKQHTPK